MSEYLRSEAEARDITVGRLRELLIAAIDRDHMVLAVLDDNVVAVPPERRSMSIGERVQAIAAYVRLHGCVCMSELDPEPVKWYPALRKMLSDGTLVAKPRVLGSKKIYYAFAEQMEETN